MLTEEQIKQKIRDYCAESDGCDLRISNKIEERIIGLSEALGAEDAWRGVSKKLLRSVGISVVAEYPEWIFEVEESNGEESNGEETNHRNPSEVKRGN